MALCAAVTCKSRVGVTPGKTFHCFPTWNPALLEVWISKLGRTTFWRPSPFSVLCSDHFEDSCFDKIGDVVHIRSDAVPTLFFSLGCHEKRRVFFSCGLTFYTGRSS
ncbi:unnamed protein product [Larinioides sclopetarius]|uniref:THAP-type domain-containing protein n=1 Tax=Larinioides sclopetarius TaxID=280406 RepID=A0AAV2AT72_9ARAC